MPFITSVLKEGRRFAPPSAMQKTAHLAKPEEYERLWRFSRDQPEAFWGEQALRFLSFFRPWQKVFEQGDDFQFAWFKGAKLNASYNAVDRHLPARGEKPAIIWEGEPGDTRTFSYRELHVEVCKFANVLKRCGLQKGDVVSVYMPMVPELVITLLACARLGIMHNVVFAGFSAEALASRNQDAGAKLIITADGGFRRGKVIPLKETVDACLPHSPTVQKVIVLQRTSQAVSFKAGRDFWWHDLMREVSEQCPAEELDAEQPLFLLYTSGSTGKPKGILHTTAGYLLGVALTSHYVFDLQEDDVYWCTADIGWITGHSYIVYGPLTNGATVFMYEGAPDTPDWGRFWQLIAKHRVTKFYTAPTAIRSFMRFGPELPQQHDLSSLRLLGSVGEPINPEAWIWYHENVGQSRCPIVDTWWQTETGATMISPLPGVSTTKPGSALIPMFGVDPVIVNEAGEEVPHGQGGYLLIKKPWPSMMRTIYGDHERFKQYWQKMPGTYFTGDGARRDEDGHFWIMGRIDDVLNVAGHRLSTMEIESALVSHPRVKEAAVVSKSDELKGEAIVAFVALQAGAAADEALALELKEHVARQIGALARPTDIRFTEGLPKTRSGKIMRRLLRDVAQGKPVQGDTSTLEGSLKF